jgi:hypothetical protein
MSCDWDLFCLDCNEAHGFDDLNHWDDTLALVAKHGPALADACAALLSLREACRVEETGAWRIELELNLRTYARVNLEWFVKHGRHRILPKDEYGRLLDECGKYYTCPACKTQKKCRRTTNHGGDCLDQRDPTPPAAPAVAEPDHRLHRE